MKEEMTIANLIDKAISQMGVHYSHIQMTPEEKAYINAHFEPMKVKKGEHLICKGEEVHYLYFLEEGNIRIWFPTKDNRDITVKFIRENTFINFFLSHEKHYAYYNAKALTHCKVWRITKLALHQFYNLSINFNKLARIHLEKSIIHKIEREEKFHTLSAEERYKLLFKTEKWLLQFIPLKHIASYIGITPQALSNIRKNI